MKRPGGTMMAGRRRAAGFTLPEVLATMVLIGIVMPVVMSAVSTALGAAGHARNLAQAAALGEAKLSELVTLQTWGRSGTSGDFGADWPQYRWQCQAQYLDFNAYQLVMQVIWTERGGEKSMQVSTIAYDNSNVTTDEGAADSSASGASS